MADIELVIKIPKDLYIKIYSDAEIMICGMRSGKTLLATLLRAIRNGASLPEGHGDLKDYAQLENHIFNLNENGYNITRSEYKMIDNVLFEMPTIIEADRSEEE